MKLNYVKRCSRFVNDYAAFVKELPDSFSEIGAMLPSSKFLAREMVKPITEYEKRLKENTTYRILEIGPGTGPFTKKIIKHMHITDELVVCEINPRLMDRLQKSLTCLDYFEAKTHRVNFYLGSVLDIPQDLIGEGFDLIVSSLPFHNFDPDVVEKFLNFYSSILKSDGTVTFFHYVGLKKLSEFSPKKELRERIRGVDKVINSWCSTASREGKIKKHVSMLNFPPAVSIRVDKR